MAGRRPGGDSSPDWFMRGLAFLVATVWAFVTIHARLNNASADLAVNGIFGVVVGALFGVSSLRRRNGNGNGGSS